jgi:hypothetical protein
VDEHRDSAAAAAAEDRPEEAVWSREWEVPGWLRGSAGRGWRPDPRTLALLVALAFMPVLAEAIPATSLAWKELHFNPPSTLLESSSFITWEHLYALSLLLELPAGALALLGAIAVLARPRWAIPYVVVGLGLAVAIAGGVMLAIVAFKLRSENYVEARYVTAAAVSVAILGLVARAAVSRRAAGAAVPVATPEA